MNLRSYDPHEPLIYLRIPKCAGRSMIVLLSRWFGDSYHQLDPEHSTDDVSKVETRDGLGNWLPNVRCLQASFNHARGFGLPYYYPEVKQYFTILRDPFDAAVSMYFSQKQTNQAGQRSDFGNRFPDVSSYLSQYPYWYFDHLPLGLDLSNYRRRLAEQFVYLGIFEDLKGSIARMARLLGKSPYEIPTLNAAPCDEPIPETLRVRFYEDYPLLKRIHEFAKEHYQRP